MDIQNLSKSLSDLTQMQANVSENTSNLIMQLKDISLNGNVASSHGDFFITGLTVFILACFVGYYVVWRVTPALHSPLMAVTNAVSSVIIVGALMSAGLQELSTASWLGLSAALLASINIFGGFLVTQRMLHMYKKKDK